MKRTVFFLWLMPTLAFCQSIAIPGGSAMWAKAGSGYSPTPDILWWKGNTGAGTTDTATVGPNCTLSSASIWGSTFTPGGSTSDLVFNGSTFFCNSASTVNYNANTTITVEFRIFATTFSNGGAAGWWILDSGGSGANGDWWFYDDFNGNTTTMVIKMWDGAGNGASYSIARPSNGAWHHIALVLKSTGGAVAPVVYVDGSSVAVTLNSDTRVGAKAFTTRTLYYGAFEGSAGFCPFSMKDVRIFGGDRGATTIAIDATNYP